MYYDDSDLSAVTGAIGGVMIFLFLIVIAICVISIIANWKIFEKMGLKGWISIVPFYNTYKMCEMTFGNGLWFLCLFASIIPYVGFFIVLLFNIVFNIRLAKSFGKDGGFVVGLVIMPFIFQLILAFDESWFNKLPDYDIHNPFA